jgi:hypothetical protein
MEWLLPVAIDPSVYLQRPLPTHILQLMFLFGSFFGVFLVLCLENSNILGVYRYMKWFAVYKSTLLLWRNLRHGMINCYYVSPF